MRMVRMMVATVLICGAGASSACNGPAGTDGGAVSDAGIDGGDARIDAGVVCDVGPQECSNGLFFADCGGSERTVFACNDSSGKCGWFTGGCPAGGGSFHVSDCPPDDICCHTTPDGPWPFAGAEGFSDVALMEAALDIAAMGWTVVDESSPAELAVTVDPSIGPPPPMSDRAVCSPGAPLQICEDAPPSFPLIRYVHGRGGVSFVVRFTTSNLHGQSVYLEVVPVDGALVARLFIRDVTDAAPPSPPTRCLPFYSGVSLSGTLRLSTMDVRTAPELVHGVLEVNLAGGHTMAVDF